MKPNPTSPTSRLRPEQETPEPGQTPSLFSAELVPLPGEQDQDYIPMTLPRPESSRPGLPTRPTR